MVALLVFLLQLCFIFFALPCTQATIFVTSPAKAMTCQAGQPCLVQWEDNGQAPLLTAIGPCYVGLYNGQAQLVQQIDPTNVASTHSLTFTPDPAAGPDSDQYYINFTSVNPIGNPPSLYSQYSPPFSLSGMSGSLASPIQSDIQTLSIPPSVVSPSSNGVSSTIVISNSFSSTSSFVPSSDSAPSSSTGSPVPSSTAPPSSSSSFVTSRVSSQTSSTAMSSTASPSSSNTSSAAPMLPPTPLWHCILLITPSLLAISLLY